LWIGTMNQPVYRWRQLDNLHPWFKSYVMKTEIVTQDRL
jgi:hypothetical protein